ncbi:hypothetical protein L2E82_05234 [Cichorium intybus]|uniref:Uncharacterized protein n=1 Tax=Cichorium intybus TaxID=13427 RepID=A0ACB9H6Y7_CICIN|nr:hypothetical protein L2E82_05234 [Cichorium intybus]
MEINPKEGIYDEDIWPLRRPALSQCSNLVNQTSNIFFKLKIIILPALNNTFRTSYDPRRRRRRLNLPLSLSSTCICYCANTIVILLNPEGCTCCVELRA